jgi:hypothetical protein
VGEHGKKKTGTSGRSESQKSLRLFFYDVHDIETVLSHPELQRGPTKESFRRRMYPKLGPILRTSEKASPPERRMIRSGRKKELTERGRRKSFSVSFVTSKICNQSRDQKYVKSKRAAGTREKKLRLAQDKTKKRKTRSKKTCKSFLSKIFLRNFQAFVFLSLRFVLCRNCFP